MKDENKKQNELEKEIKQAIATKLWILSRSEDNKLIIIDEEDRKGNKSFGLNQIKDITKVSGQDNISRYFFEGEGGGHIIIENKYLNPFSCTFKGYAILNIKSNDIEVEMENNTIYINKLV